MPDLRSPEWTIYLLQLLIAAFIAVLFLQSGVDKVFDRAGNRAYLDEHFARSPLARTVGPMFLIVTILEVAAGGFWGGGGFPFLFFFSLSVAVFGGVVAASNNGWPFFRSPGF